MSSRRTLILIAAIAIGAIAAFALYNYIDGIEQRAHQDAELVDVFRVDRTVPQGFGGETAIDEGFIVRSQIPREFLPATHIRELDQISGLVARNELAANQVLVDGMFVDPADALISFAERIPDDEATVTISVDQVRGVAGLLVPGDRVNMLVRPPIPGDVEDDPLAEEPEDAPEAALGPGTPDSIDPETLEIPYGTHPRYLYQGVEILAIGRSPQPQPGETVDASEVAGQSGLITFAVPPDAVQRIIGVSDIYLSLVNPDYEPRVLPMPDPYEVLPGENPDQLTPYGPDGNRE